MIYVETRGCRTCSSCDDLITSPGLICTYSVRMFWDFSFIFVLFQGIARTQSPLRKNYALESPAFGVIAEVNLTEVQWKGLTLDRLPSGSKFSPCQVSMLRPVSECYITKSYPQNKDFCHIVILAPWWQSMYEASSAGAMFWPNTVKHSLQQ